VFIYISPNYPPLSWKTPRNRITLLLISAILSLFEVFVVHSILFVPPPPTDASPCLIIPGSFFPFEGHLEKLFMTLLRTSSFLIIFFICSGRATRFPFPPQLNTELIPTASPLFAIDLFPQSPLDEVFPSRAFFYLFRLLEDRSSPVVSRPNRSLYLFAMNTSFLLPRSLTPGTEMIFCCHNFTVFPTRFSSRFSRKLFSGFPHLAPLPSFPRFAMLIKPCPPLPLGRERAPSLSFLAPSQSPNSTRRSRGFRSPSFPL